MTKYVGLLALGLTLLVGSVARAQFPILDQAVEKVVQRYQGSTCEQLWEQRSKPKSAQEQELVRLLRTDAQMRTAFLGKIAAPVANKMFECGMIP